jgi:hypothetical protein
MSPTRRPAPSTTARCRECPSSVGTAVNTSASASRANGSGLCASSSRTRTQSRWRSWRRSAETTEMRPIASPWWSTSGKTVCPVRRRSSSSSQDHGDRECLRDSGCYACGLELAAAEPPQRRSQQPSAVQRERRERVQRQQQQIPRPTHSSAVASGLSSRPISPAPTSAAPSSADTAWPATATRASPPGLPMLRRRAARHRASTA